MYNQTKAKDQNSSSDQYYVFNDIRLSRHMPKTKIKMTDTNKHQMSIKNFKDTKALLYK